jgi:hypothetical protein
MPQPIPTHAELIEQQKRESAAPHQVEPAAPPRRPAPAPAGWQPVAEQTTRLRVARGYLYRVESAAGLAITFVPDRTGTY